MTASCLLIPALVCCHNGHADHLNALTGGTALAAAGHFTGCFADHFQHLIALDQLAKSGVLTVEERGIAEADEELAACRIGVGCPRHGDHAALVGAVVKLRLDFVARVAGSPQALVGFIPGQRIASLRHKTVDNAVKGRAVVEAVTGELLEVLHGFWGNFFPEAQLHYSLGGLDNCDFITHALTVGACRAKGNPVTADFGVRLERFFWQDGQLCSKNESAWNRWRKVRTSLRSSMKTG